MPQLVNDLGLFIAGLVLLLAGGEAMVRGSTALARRAGVSPLVIGIVLVGFGTSSPELVTSVEAALLDQPGIAFGNVVGSNIANMLGVLGFAALFAPVALDRDLMGSAIGALTAAALFAALAWADLLTRWVGLGLVGALAAYLIMLLRDERHAMRRRRLEAARATIIDGPPLPLHSVRPALVVAVIGVSLLVLGGKILVGAAASIAAGLGVEPSVIGVTIVAVGTSMPEMVAAMMAVLRGRADLALGNILGSNIYNVLGIGGATLVVAPLAAPPHMLRLDVPVMVAASALFVVLAWTGSRLTRREGAILVILYGAFLALVSLA